MMKTAIFRRNHVVIRRMHPPALNDGGQNDSTTLRARAVLGVSLKTPHFTDEVCRMDYEASQWPLGSSRESALSILN